MLDAVEGAGGDGQRLELEVHGEGGGAEVVRLVGPTNKKLTVNHEFGTVEFIYY